MSAAREVSVVLGISCGFHDAAAAILVDGVVAAAVEEERLSRTKHDASFPDRAIDTCLSIAGLEPGDVDLVAFYEKPLGVVHRHVMSKVASGPAGLLGMLTTTPRVVRDQLTVPSRIDRWFDERGTTPPAVQYVEHHDSHAAAAFYPSPFESAAVITVDGVGEWATSTIGDGTGNRLRVERELRYPDSVGLLYSAFTAYCGFRVNSGEGELMGLAPFGDPRFEDLILDRLVTIHDDGSIHLDQRYFAYVGGRRTIGPRFEALFGGAARPPGRSPEQRDADLAASVQRVLERIVGRMAEYAHEVTGRRNLCLAGGVALNCVANGRVLLDGPFDDVWVQPAAGDAGGALGAALASWHGNLGSPRTVRSGDAMSGGFLGPAFGRDEIEAWLDAAAIEHEVVPDDDERAERVARLLAAGRVIGWFAGRMEFGPRALGHRSILADPRSDTVQERINALVKERATFRPFAPAVLADRAVEWFDLEDHETPYMTFAVPVARARWEDDPDASADDSPEVRVSRRRSAIPAVTHVDRSARVQTVDQVRNPEFTRLLQAFADQSGCPVLLNTSFNARDEPIVCTPEDAYRTFRRIGLDVLVLEHCIITATSGDAA